MAVIWDFVVAGAGPAGSRAAELLARRGASVLLLDPKAPWEKPCGGGLTAAALRNTPDLAELAPQGELTRELLVITPTGASVVVPFAHPFLTVSRLTLSRWGLERAKQAGATFRAAAVKQIAREAAGWDLIDGRGAHHRARWLVAADGSASMLRNRLAPRFKPTLDPTRVIYPTGGIEEGRAALMILPRCVGYVWDFRRPGHHSIGVGVAPGTLSRAALDQAVARYAAVFQVDGGGGPRRGAVIATTDWESGGFQDLAGRDYVLLGDAAGLADPVTGEGIDYAFRSAAIAARAFDEVRGFTAYPGMVRAAFRREIERSRFIRRFVYRPAVIETLVRGAQHTRLMGRAVWALGEIVNQHTGLIRGARQALFPTPAERETARAIQPGRVELGQLGPGPLRPSAESAAARR